MSIVIKLSSYGVSYQIAALMQTLYLTELERNVYSNLSTVWNPPSGLSAGVFQTYKQGKVKVTFSQYSDSEMIRPSLDVVDCDGTDQAHLYDMTIGKDTIKAEGITRL